MRTQIAVTPRSDLWGRIRLSKARSRGQPAGRRPGTDTLSQAESEVAALVEQMWRRLPTDAYSRPEDPNARNQQDRDTLAVFADYQRTLEARLLDQYIASGELAAIELGRKVAAQYRAVGKADTPIPSQAALNFRFDRTDPRAIDWARQYAGQRITNMTRDQQAVMRDLIQQALSTGRTPGAVGRDLYEALSAVAPGTQRAQYLSEMFGAQVNGLTVRSERAVFNRATTVAADLASRGVQPTKLLEQVRRETDQYAARLRRSRARTIARTEILTASNAGRMGAYQQAVDAGMLDPKHAVKEWEVGPFDVCPICVELGRTTSSAGIPLTQPFQASNGWSGDAPPAHPNCRCTVEINPNAKLYEPTSLQGGGTVDDPYRFGDIRYSPAGEAAGRPAVPRTPRQPRPQPAPAPRTPQPPPRPTPPPQPATPPQSLLDLARPAPPRGSGSNPFADYGPGPQGTRRVKDLVERPDATRGRRKVRADALDETVDMIDQLHGLADDGVLPVEIDLAGKAQSKGGHFTPGTRGARPRRKRGESFAEWRDKVEEYNSRTLRPQIRITDSGFGAGDEVADLGKQMLDMAHEMGHRVDWDGSKFVVREAFNKKGLDLSKRYGPQWVEHLDEVTDPLDRAVLDFIAAARETKSVQTYGRGGAYRAYYTSPVEVWARAYCQWVADVAGNSTMRRGLEAYQRMNFQFTDEEMTVLRPLIERILRLRGLMR